MSSEVSCSKPRVTQQRGITLIELMVGMIVGLIVLSAVLYVFLVTLRTEKDVYNSSLLIREASAINDIMSGEFRRIGYNSASVAASSSEVALRQASDCFVYRYDKDETTPGYDSFFAFRRTVDVDGIGYLAYGTGVSTASCSGSWARVTPPSVDLTALSFQPLVSAAVGSSTTDFAQYVEYEFTLGIPNETLWRQVSGKSVKIRNDISQ